MSSLSAALRILSWRRKQKGCNQCSPGGDEPYRGCVDESDLDVEREEAELIEGQSRALRASNERELRRLCKAH
jgi:hypothetical protein